MIIFFALFACAAGLLFLLVALALDWLLKHLFRIEFRWGAPGEHISIRKWRG